MKVFNERLASKRKAVLIRGQGRFTRYAVAVACVEEGKLIHVESYFGNDGRIERGKAARYMAQYLAGYSLGLESPLYRIGMTTTFNTAANRAKIDGLA